MAEICHLA